MNKNNFLLLIKSIFSVIFLSALIFSCTTSNVEFSNESVKSSQVLNENEFQYESESQNQKISRAIYDNGIKNQKSLYKFFISKCPKKNRFKAKKIAKIYIEECLAEGINSDVAFVQMCLETNFLRYGNLVKPAWNNFCGLGAINKDNPGLKFKNMKTGVRAHVQHLHAYGTTGDIALKNELVDPRYKYVNPRGKAQDIFGLSGTWAADKQYSQKLDRLLETLEGF